MTTIIKHLKLSFEKSTHQYTILPRFH